MSLTDAVAKLHCRVAGHQWRTLYQSPNFRFCLRCGDDGYFLPTSDDDGPNLPPKQREA